jgi:hypothetical protein
MYVENLCNIVENYHIDPCTYDDLNVLRSCDLSEHSITTAQKCQGGADKNSHTEHRKNINNPYKYSLED